MFGPEPDARFGVDTGTGWAAPGLIPSLRTTRLTERQRRMDAPTLPDLTTTAFRRPGHCPRRLSGLGPVRPAVVRSPRRVGGRLLMPSRPAGSDTACHRPVPAHPFPGHLRAPRTKHVFDTSDVR